MDTLCTTIASVGTPQADALGWSALVLGFVVAVALGFVARASRDARRARSIASASAGFAVASAVLGVIAAAQSGPAHHRADDAPARHAVVLYAPNALAAPWSTTVRPAGEWTGTANGAGIPTANGPHAPGTHERGDKTNAGSGAGSGTDLQKLLHDQEHQSLPAPARA